MDILLDLLQQVSETRNGKESSLLELLIMDIVENGEDRFEWIEKKYHCQIFFSKEKHNVLQYTYYFTITSLLVDAELNLEIESGINNGTQFNGYSFSGSLLPESRMVEVLKDVVLDKSKYAGSRFSLQKARLVFPRYKEQILKLLKNRSYDNYVTGGGTEKTNKFYKTELDKIREFGIFWECIYEDVEADLNLV